MASMQMSNTAHPSDHPGSARTDCQAGYSTIRLIRLFTPTCQSAARWRALLSSPLMLRAHIVLFVLPGLYRARYPPRSRVMGGGLVACKINKHLPRSPPCAWYSATALAQFCDRPGPHQCHTHAPTIPPGATGPPSRGF